MNTFLLKHSVDLSLLTNGFHIQTEFHQLVYALPGGALHHGESREIKVLINGEEFTTKLYNIGFDQNKYPDHPDLLQVRYSPGSPIARKLQSVFAEDYRYLMASRELAGPRKQIRLPNDNHDEIVFLGTAMPNVFILDCISSEERKKAATEIRQMSELDFENAFEAHHIVPFTQSLNNDTSNIIIVSPDYHRIIHKAKPEWDCKKLSFKFPNGLQERVKVNKHLGL